MSSRKRFRVIAHRIEKCIIELDAYDRDNAEAEVRQLLSSGWPSAGVERTSQPHMNDCTLSEWSFEPALEL
jgi:hypothetical protein